MEKNLHYYEEPVQVKFYECFENEEPQYVVGIAYHDYVICACCGGIFDIEDAFANADEDKFGGDVVIPLGENWVDFSDYIQ